jgi:hypothetical protein
MHEKPTSTHQSQHDPTRSIEATAETENRQTAQTCDSILGFNKIEKQNKIEAEAET